MVVRMRHTRAHTANRRSHHAIKATLMTTCENCGAKNLNHTICKYCGFYKGRNVMNKLAKVEKSQAKAKKTSAK
ncbi:MAG: 50S ribosomal protein L32 [Candidatus Pacebacteria bacterium]|nr:50S ribosomal protein L32 [Candidatus Paceibacterota bacterium]